MLGVSGLFCHFYPILMENPSVNNVDLIRRHITETPHYVTSDLSLHCLPMTLSRV